MGDPRIKSHQMGVRGLIYVSLGVLWIEKVWKPLASSAYLSVNAAYNIFVHVIHLTDLNEQAQATVFTQSKCMYNI